MNSLTTFFLNLIPAKVNALNRHAKVQSLADNIYSRILYSAVTQLQYFEFPHIRVVQAFVYQHLDCFIVKPWVTTEVQFLNVYWQEFKDSLG
jgi:methyl coenzyme M reductase subunit C